MDRILNSWLVIAVTSVVLIIWTISLQRKRKAHRAVLSAASSVNFTDQPLAQLNDYVYEVHRPAGRPSVEILFFHGLQLGRSKEVYLTTWLSADGSQLWVQWILTKFPDARILLISYDASAWRTFEEGLTDMYITCENLVHSLTDDKAHVGEDGCPVLLVGHSLGGLVMKELCTKLHVTRSKRRNQRVENLLLKVRGLFFYACPHHGSRLADNSTCFSQGLLFEDVTTLNKETQRRNEEFRELRSKYGWETYGIGEGRPTTLGVFKKIHIVTEASARHDVDNFYTNTDADHFTVCRPAAVTSSSFRLLSDFITRVVEKAPEEQGPKIDIPHKVIGLDEQVKTIREKLKGCPRIGIVGMGGIGKTTFAKVVFNTISVGFEYTCFLRDVKIHMANRSDSSYLQAKIVEHMFHKRSEVDKSFKWKSLQQKDVLIVLDDVECKTQVLDVTLLDYFSDKSRLIVTSRDSGFLPAEKFECHFVKPLDIENSKRLFCLNAFNTEDQLVDDTDHVHSILRKCKGFPLALEVVGKYLYAEHEKSLWDDAVQKLRLAQPLSGAKNDPLSSMLMVSYEALAENEQQMFLDVSTCFHGEHLDVVKGAWAVCGWASPHSGLKNLLNKGLVIIEDDKIQMHEVLRDLGRSIACPDPKNIACHSRVCYEGSDPLGSHLPDGENFKVKILKISWVPYINIQMLHGLKELRILWLTGTDLQGPWNSLPQKLAVIRIRYCELDASHHSEWLPSATIEPSCQTLGRLPNLRYLEVDGLRNMGDFLGTIGELQGLEYFSIRSEDLEVLPETLGQLQALKSLKIFCPKLDYIPNSLRKLLNLKCLVIDYCIPNSLRKLLEDGLVRDYYRSVTEISDFLGGLQALEDLRLFGTGMEAATQSVGQLKGLQHLEVTWCSNNDGKAPLDALASALGQLPALRRIVIHSCHLHKKCPSSIDQLQFLESLTTTGILQGVGQVDLPVFHGDSVKIVASELQVLPCRFRQLKHAKFLTIKRCRYLTHLADILGQFPALESLKIHDCDNLEALPHTLGELQALRELSIRSCGHLKSLPGSLGKLQALETLAVEDCSNLESLPCTVGDLQALGRLGIESCKKLKSLPDALGNLQALETLAITRCNNLDALPGTIGELRALRTLDVQSCEQLKSLPDSLGNLEALESLKIWKCEQLKSLPDSLGNLQALETLTITNCDNLDDLPGTIGELRALQELFIQSCPQLKSLPDSLGNLQALKSLQVSYCEQLKSLPDSFGNLQALETLTIRNCDLPVFRGDSVEIVGSELQVLPWRFTHAKSLTIKSCRNLTHLPDVPGQFQALKCLEIQSCEQLKSLPDSFGNLQALEKLAITGCDNLDDLPGTIGELRALRTLDVQSCVQLKSLPDSLGNLQALESLQVSYCEQLKSLPDSLGNLQALESLKIWNCEQWKSLPDSLGNLQALKSLEIWFCEQLKSLPDSLGNLQALKSLEVRHCDQLKSLPDSLRNLQALETLTITNCDNLDDLPGTIGELRALQELDIQSCPQLKSLPDSLGNLQALKSLVVRDCEQLKSLPDSLGNLQALKSLEIWNCEQLKSLPDSLGNLQGCFEIS